MVPIAENIFGGYTVMVSGGKDSTVITDLAVRSGANGVMRKYGNTYLPYNPLYDKGHKRVGCPMRANKTELEENQKWAALYKKTGGRFLKEKTIREEKYSDEDTYYRWGLIFAVAKRGCADMKRKTPEERYRENVRNQQKILEEFAAHEIEWADDLLLWYRIRKEEIPNDEYRTVAFFKDHEYLNKPGALTLLYEMYLRCIRELPEYTREIAFDLLAFRYKMYAEVLKKGGYDGRADW